MKTSWFFSEANMLNTKNSKKPIKRSEPVKVFRGRELEALASSMGFAVAPNAGRIDINPTNLPDALKKFVR
jgi:hypothetical protein